MVERKSVLFYTDLLPAIELLDDSDAGALLKAVLRYAATGTETQLTGSAAFAWALLKPRIDYDGERYQRAALQRQYATFAREAKKKGETPIDFETWLDNDRQRPITADNEDSDPTTDRDPIPTPSAMPIPNQKIKNKPAKPVEPSVSDLFSEYAGEDARLLEALTEFAQMRKKKKAQLTTNTAQRLLRKLDGFPPDERVDVLIQSCDHCWVDIYALKTEETSSKGQKDGKSDNNKWDLPPLPGVRRV